MAADTTSEVIEAEQYLAVLQERVLAGDPDINTSELDAARELVEHAKQRQHATQAQDPLTPGAIS